MGNLTEKSARETYGGATIRPECESCEFLVRPLPNARWRIDNVTWSSDLLRSEDLFGNTVEQLLGELVLLIQTRCNERNRVLYWYRNRRVESVFKDVGLRLRSSLSGCDTCCDLSVGLRLFVGNCSKRATEKETHTETYNRSTLQVFL